MFVFEAMTCELIRLCHLQHEEEMYTNKIIEAFNAGLLKLPENTSGVTLRSYLAEKLGCDPMRITKKYTGASCLGKRVYHKESSSANADEVEKVQKELLVLENKFLEKLEQMRRERREHESAIDGMFITTPNIDAMLVHGGALSMPYGNSSNMATYQHPFHHLSGPMSGGSIYLANSHTAESTSSQQAAASKANSMNHSFHYAPSDKLRNDFYSLSSSPGKSSYSAEGVQERSNSSTYVAPQYPYRENHITSLANPSQLAYIQMLASCGPYISTKDDRAIYMSTASTASTIHNARGNASSQKGRGSERSDNTDEEKMDSSTDGSSSTSNLRQSLKRLNAESIGNESSSTIDSNGSNNGCSSDTSSNGNSEEDQFTTKVSKTGRKNTSNPTVLSSSSASSSSSSSSSDAPSTTNGNLPEDDHLAASSLIGFFNHVKRTSSQNDLVDFVQDVQKSVVQRANVPMNLIPPFTRVISTPDLTATEALASASSRKRHYSESLPGAHMPEKRGKADEVDNSHAIGIRKIATVESIDNS
jgi:hypothetical protein